MAKDPRQVTEKDTKPVILAALHQALEQIEEMQAGQLNPQAIKEQKAKAETIAKAGEIKQGNLVDDIASASKHFIEKMEGLKEGVATTLANLQTLEETIGLKEAELQELYGIEKHANTLAAIINASNIQKAQLEKEYAERKFELQAEVNEMVAQINGLTEKYETLDEEYEAELKKTQKRKTEEFDYTFNRECQSKRDKLDDDLAAKRKIHNDDLAADRKKYDDDVEILEKRVREVADREAKQEELEKQIIDFPSRLELATATARLEAKAEAEKEFSFERKSLEQEKTFMEKELNAKIEMLNEALNQERAAHKATTSKLDAAYEKINTMASKAVDAAKTETAANKVLAAASDSKQK